MNNFAQRDVIDVAVDKARTRSISQGLAIQALYRFVVTRPAFTQIKIRSESRHVRQKLLDRDRVAATTFHLGNEFNDGIREPPFAALDQNHDAGCRGDDLCETGKIENRVRRHRLALRFNRARSIGFTPDDLAVMTDEHYRTRQLFVLDRFFDNWIDPSEAFDGDSRISRRRWTKLRDIRWRQQKRERNDEFRAMRIHC